MAWLSSIFGLFGSQDPPAREPPDLSFKYGWCTTDEKPGLKIRATYRKTDYMKDEPYASRVREMLEQLGLPYPEDEEIFRGTHHDLLFLDSHGVVIRIGPTDVTDLMNPGILQPLGWLEDNVNMIEIELIRGERKKVPFTVAIYPGIELRKDYGRENIDCRPHLAGNLNVLLRESGQEIGDTTNDNKGIIRVPDDKGQEVAVEVLLDSDNVYNASCPELARQRATSLRQHQSECGDTDEVVSRTLRDIFNDASDIDRNYLRAFQLHQPLRRLFWAAFDSVKSIEGQPDAQSRRAFWDRCAEVTNRPEAVVLPVWRMHKNADGKAVYKRDEVSIPHLVLYRPWTGAEADKVPEPVPPATGLKALIQKVHGLLMPQPAGKTQGAAQKIQVKV